MSHETTATRRYVDESLRKPMSDLVAHVGDLLLHVSAEDRARWNAAGKGEKGDKGDKGDPGEPGSPGEKGDTGDQGAQGPAGPQGKKGEPGEKGDDGKTGEKGEKGDKGDKGDPGEPGVDGADGADGADGKSAYQIACDNGFEGTVSEWLESLKGKTSFDALTAEQKASLKGNKGDPGEKGARGERGSRWHASDTGTFSGDDTTPGNFSGVGTFVDDAQPGDMLLMTSAHKIYECLAARGDTYDGVAQDQSLWAYRMSVVGEKGEQGEKGERGDTGSAGPPPTLLQPTVTTLEEGAEATATVSGSAADGYRLEFGIPRGYTGMAGLDGMVGPMPEITAEAVAVEAGSPPTAVATEIIGGYMLTLGIPEGNALRIETASVSSGSTTEVELRNNRALTVNVSGSAAGFVLRLPQKLPTGFGREFIVRIVFASEWTGGSFTLAVKTSSSGTGETATLEKDSPDVFDFSGVVAGSKVLMTFTETDTSVLLVSQRTLQPSVEVGNT